MSKRLFIANLAAFLFATTAHAQFDTTDLSAILNRSKDKLGKHLVFQLYKDGKVLYKKESGELTAKSVVPINASSQWLTTALVMTFVQEGKLSLDDKVSDYLPIFAKYYKGFITIRHCLTFNTGIESDGKIFSKNKYNSLEAEVNEYASKKGIKTNAGTEFRYNNVGFNIAGRVLEVITKRAFDRLMTERIIRPLAMKNTTFANEDYNNAINPSTGAKSTANDYLNFVTMLLNKGTFNNKIVLQPQSVAALYTLQAEGNAIKGIPKLNETANYGLGTWLIESTDKGTAAVVAVPSLSGTYPLIDICRGYAFVLFTRELNSEIKKDVYQQIKNAIDEQVKGIATCQ